MAARSHPASWRGAKHRVTEESARAQAACRRAGGTRVGDLEMPLARGGMEALFHEQPKTGNQYLEDALLRGYLRTHFLPRIVREVDQDLERFGNLLLTQIRALGWECELKRPVLRQYDAWGWRVGHVVTCSAWRRMKEIAAEEGLVAEDYKRRYSNWSRLHQAVKLYLFSSSSGRFNCPLAMTDGAAKVIESLGIPGSLKNAFGHLTSRDPKKFWTSGQWMTERRGGSDVATETVARKQPDGTYRLYAFKWFTSAADSDVTLTLARVVDAEGQGSGGLSLFFLKVRDEEGKLNNIQVQRLKAKLGTRQMATAELWLDGAKAELVQTRGAFLLLMDIIRLLGLAETNMASEQDQLLLRVLVPAAKLYTGKRASAVVIEAMESFGGQGYMEDTGLPVIVRDAQVLSIWEGTTNILSLDVLRSLSKSQGQAMAAFLSSVQRKLDLASSTGGLEPAVGQTRAALGRLEQFLRAAGPKGALTMELAARDVSYTLARLHTGALLLEHAARPDASSTDIATARRDTVNGQCPHRHCRAELSRGGGRFNHIPPVTSELWELVPELVETGRLDTGLEQAAPVEGVPAHGRGWDWRSLKVPSNLNQAGVL
ncbi:acyl-CoA dehydrogenase family member 11-like isoform X5 [Lathamus discolor]|uniref:acyl-CoA dehydrogenase family member 11-like isoform X5 n=1 Tax=Lathamus discolor TaxID=678569 RepID=UPI0032B79730